MSVLSRIRNNIGLVAVIIAIALLGFILTDLFTSLGGRFNTPANAGSVGGQTITAQEFAERYQNTIAQYGGGLTDAQRANIMDNVWNQMASEIAYSQELEKVGLTISGQEILDMFTGDNIHPIVRQYFVQPGQEPDPAQIRMQLQNVMQNPEAKLQLRQLEDYLAEQRAREQYENMIKAGFVGSQTAAQYKHNQQNTRVNIEYVGINYTSVPDSMISVTESEMRAYIADHPNEYQQEAATFINYVNLPITPTVDDTLRAYDEMLRMKDRFASAPDDSAFMSGYSRIPFNSTPRAIQSLPENIRDSVNNAEIGQVLGPVRAGGYWKLYKIVDITEGESESIKLNHIFINPVGNTAADTIEARQQARDIARQTNAGNFQDMVIEHTKDFVSKRVDGLLGWVGTNNRYGEDFFEGIKDLPVGAVRGPIESAQGFHIVEILDKTSKEYVIAEVENEIFASSATRDKVYSEINQIADQAQNAIGNLDSAAKATGYTAVRSNPLDESTNQITGLPGGRELVLWAIKAKVGDFSEVVQIGEAFVYGQVIERREEGLQSLDNVRGLVYPKVLNMKKADIIMDKMSGISIGDDMQAIKDAYGEGAYVSNASNITFESPSIPGIGADPFIIGRVSVLEEGEVTKPLEGTNGVFVIKATQVQPAADLDEDALMTKRETEVTTEKNALSNKIPQAVMDIANVKDERWKAGY